MDIQITGYLEEGPAEPLALADGIDVDVLYTGLVVSDAPWADSVPRIRTFMGGRGLADRANVEYLPIRYGAIPDLFASGAVPIDVAYVQTAPDGSMGTHVGYMPEVLATAARVVVEVNAAMPSLAGSPVVADAESSVHTERPLVDVPRREASPVDLAIAAHVVTLIPSGSTIEVGLGALPDAVLATLGATRRNLRFRSGMVGDSGVDLAESGALADDEIVTTSLIGTARLYVWAAGEPRLRMAPASEVHSIGRLAAVDGFIALNSALEVDLTGQVGAEEVGGRRVSGLGGQADFAAGATLAPSGKSIIALPAARIVDALSGPVSTPRADVGFVVTEHGIAELAGKTLEERGRALLEVRSPR